MNTLSLSEPDRVTAHRLSPFQQVVPKLVASIKRALLVAIEVADDFDKSDAADAEINRHFAWLALASKIGENRHLYDGSTDGSTAMAPLRTKALRVPQSLPRSVFEELAAGEPIDANLKVMIDGKEEHVVQQKATRISLLILSSVRDTRRAEQEDWDESSSPLNYLRSPLAIALDFLTIPSMPGSQAYSLTTLRNYLFDVLGVYPEPQHLKRSRKNGESVRRYFQIDAIESAYSAILTSVRFRYYSRGRDPLPKRGRTLAGTFLREYFALRGYFFLRFQKPEARQEFCKSPDFSGEFEFVRSPFLEKIPEIGELINEIWGVLLPIRGADTVFRGALKFSSEGGLVVAIHGGAGSGKTTLSLALGAYLAPFGIDTFFVTAEEHEGDLRSRANSICPENYKRLSFFPSNSRKWLFIQRVSTRSLEAGQELNETIKNLRAADLARASLDESSGALRPCKAVVVLDGIHDLLSITGTSSTEALRLFIAECRQLHALVIMTTGEEWAGDVRIDYLVDMAMHLSNAATTDYGRKPDRRLLLTKARFQLCATGTHGFQIAGDKGVRLSPQINYQLDRRAIWKARLPDFDAVKVIMRLQRAPNGEFSLTEKSVNIPRGSNIFINGLGSGGKAALAVKLAMAPLYRAKGFERGSSMGPNRKRFLDESAMIWERENILIVSFLYATDYYRRIFERLRSLRSMESPLGVTDLIPYYEVIQLYPGYLKPNDLFNRIEWRLREAEADGMPFTSVVIEGIHNVFLQFPELQAYPVFWPQLFSMLRSRPLTTITTHTNMDLTFRGWTRPFDEYSDYGSRASAYQVDDKRSEPLRHALLQQTDFSFDVTPRAEDRNEFYVGVKSAINQSIPRDPMVWSRQGLVFTAGYVEQPDFFES